MASSRSKGRQAGRRRRQPHIPTRTPSVRDAGVRQQSELVVQRAVAAVRGFPATFDTSRRVTLPGWLGAILAAESPLWAYLLLVLPVIAVGFSLTVGLRANRIPFVDNDYWWHMATGNWILDHHRIPTTDPFSWTVGGRNWVAHEWLGEVLLALTVRAVGYGGAIVLTGIVLVAGFWRLLSAARWYGLSRRAAVVLMLLWGGMFVRAGNIVVRPQVWGWVLLCVLLAELVAYDVGRRRSLWLVPLIFLVWININLTALVGVACLGVFALDRLVRRQLDRPLVLACVLSAVALFINPRGPELLRWSLKYADPHAWRYTYIFEWKSPRLADHSFIPFWLALPLVPLALWALVRWRPRLWPGLLILAFCYEGLKAIRYIPIYGIFAFLFAGWLVWYWAQRHDTVPAAAGNPLFDLRWPTFAAPALATAIVLIVATTSANSQLHWSPNTHGFPAQTTTALLDDYPNLTRQFGTIRLYNTYDYGGYLIYRLYPKIKVYVDGREELYGDPFLRQYISIEFGDPGWQEIVEGKGINVALVRRGDGIFNEMVNDPVWQPIAQDPYSALFVYSPKPNTP